MKQFAEELLASPEFQPLTELSALRIADERVTAALPLHPLVAVAMARSAHPLLVITATGRQAEDFVAALNTWDPSLRAVSLPSWETLPHERLSPSLDAMGRRLAVLHRLTSADRDDPLRAPIDVLVASIRAVAQPIFEANPPALRIRAGQDVDPTTLVHELVDLGFERVDLVERRGHVALRGGIVDVFGAADEHPARIEFWGDTVEDIRFFSVADQRSLDTAADGILITPVREVRMTDGVRQRAAQLMLDQPALADICGPVSAGIFTPGMEALGSLLVEGVTSLIEVLDPAAAVLVSQPERVERRMLDLHATVAEFARAAWLTTTPVEAGGLLTGEQLRHQARTRDVPWWQISEFAVDTSGGITLPAKEMESYRGDISRAIADLGAWCAEGRRVLFIATGQGSAERWTESFAEHGLALHQHGVTVTTGDISNGFLSAAFAVLSESDLLAQRSATKDMRRMPTRRRRSIDPLALKRGDFIVHEQHGVGRYIEMAQRTVAGAQREYVVVEYAASKRGQPPDRLYVPMDQLDAITQYVGGEAPSVHRLGGSEWQQTKRRARKAVKELTDGLVRLYAARASTQGYAFGSDTPWQHELEDAFAYVETADQLACIDEVKADMQRSMPMDRLICGDVGYGKTEIAVRAAFKAVQDGKQVAILVPTTLLVQQHLNTFTERYTSFPITVAGISRFSTEAEVRRVQEGLKAGAVDIVIGTHRMLTPDVRFKDLGLVVIDEEQRFGVEHKEHLKALRTNVDVLAMSATPIPRTLEMAVTGIREMSVIQTPPEERHPVLTFVGPYEEKQVAAAVRRELIRDGQVFFVHNRVNSIDRVANRIAALVPEARIAVAHGQMPERALEKIIIGFWEGAIDVLVCTTIVESGIDVPNANTLIVDRADLLGLAQLHQLRGRVGRGRERAYAYFMYPEEGGMTEAAHERLSTIAQHNELGAGMHIAMKDLEIRGAGNLLGGEQSGHIAEVGFDLYVRMVGEALAEVKGEPEVHGEIKVELPLNALIPSDYIPHERLRLEAYRRIAGATDVAEVREELVDRYGPLPEQAALLLEVAEFRSACRSAGIEEVVAQGQFIRFAPVHLAESAHMRVERLYPGTVVKAATGVVLVPRPKTGLTPGAPLICDSALLAWARNVVAELQPAVAPVKTGAP